MCGNPNHFPEDRKHVEQGHGQFHVTGNVTASSIRLRSGQAPAEPRASCLRCPGGSPDNPQLPLRASSRSDRCTRAQPAPHPRARRRTGPWPKAGLPKAGGGSRSAEAASRRVVWRKCIGHLGKRNTSGDSKLITRAESIYATLKIT